MKIWRKIVLVIILMIFFYIISRFIFQRMQLLVDGQNAVEGFVDVNVEKLSKANPIAVNISSYQGKNYTEKNGIADPTEAVRLRQYCIKAAYNSAYDGVSVGTDMLSYVLSRGVRFLDLELYWGIPSIDATGANAAKAVEMVCVAYSADPYVPSTNLIALSDVMNHLYSNAFTGPIPNNSDPLFIQFRVKYQAPISTDSGASASRLTEIYNKIATTINPRTGGKRFSGVVNATTDISTIGPNIVYVMDTRYNGDYKTLSSDLKDAIHMDTKSSALNSYTLSEIKNVAPKLSIGKDGFQVSLTTLTELQPVNSDARTLPDNYDMVDYVNLYGCNITPMMFYSNDTSLEKYEMMFNVSNSAFAPVSACMKYLNQTKINPDSIRRMNYPTAFGGK